MCRPATASENWGGGLLNAVTTLGTPVGYLGDQRVEAQGWLTLRVTIQGEISTDTLWGTTEFPDTLCT